MSRKLWTKDFRANKCACPKCSMRCVIEIFDKNLIKLNDFLRSTLKKVTTKSYYFHHPGTFFRMLNGDADPDFKKSVIREVIYGETFGEKNDYNAVTYNQSRSQVIFLIV